jgi:hypothetical protein
MINKTSFIIIGIEIMVTVIYKHDTPSLLSLLPLIYYFIVEERGGKNNDFSSSL